MVAVHGVSESDMTEHKAHAEASLPLSLLFTRLCAHVLCCRQDRCWALWDAAFTPPRVQRGEGQVSLDGVPTSLTISQPGPGCVDTRALPQPWRLRCGIVQLEVSHRAFPSFSSSPLCLPDTLQILSLSHTLTHMHPQTQPHTCNCLSESMNCK